MTWGFTLLENARQRLYARLGPMPSTDDADWAAYYRRLRGRTVRPLLTQGLAVYDRLHGVSTSNGEQGTPGATPVKVPTAVDIGFGDGSETIALAQRGWRVHAVDPEPAAATWLDRRMQTELSVTQRHATTYDTATVENAQLPGADFILGCASLPFIPPETFPQAWETLLNSMKPGAVMAVHLFGVNDSWATGSQEVSGMSFHADDDIRALTHDLTVHHMQSHEYDGPSGRGPKHWHRIDLILS